MKFTMWSFWHYIFIISPFVICYVLYALTKNKDALIKRKIGVIISIIAIVILALRNIEILINDNFRFSAELLPLQICHFANFVLLFAFFKNNQRLFTLSFCLNLPAAMMSIIYANSLTNYSVLTFRGLAYTFGHIIIVALALWAVFVGFVKINKRTLLETLGLMGLLYVGSLIINNLLRLFGHSPNYFYSISFEPGTPLETFYNIGTVYNFSSFTVNPVYMLLTGILGVIVVFIFYFIYRLIMYMKFDLKTNKRNEVNYESNY